MRRDMGVYLNLDGIKNAVKTMNGNETIHMGIRPYAMHAGNALAIVAYPILLCEELQKLGKTPSFHFILSLNDWEQTSLTGEDIYKYTFDVYPEHTTIEYSLEEDGSLTVDAWGSHIIQTTNEIKTRFPSTSIKTIRNSELKSHKVMRDVIIKTIKDRKILKNIMLKSSGKPSNGSDSYYANALCPECKHANTNTNVTDQLQIKISCQRCSVMLQGEYDEFSYWLHHKPLFAARWNILGFTHSISGGDHYHEGDAKTRTDLYEFFFDKEAPNLNMIFSPVLLGTNGQKMSKSRSNHFPLETDRVLELARNNNGYTINNQPTIVKVEENSEILLSYQINLLGH